MISTAVAAYPNKLQAQGPGEISVIRLGRSYWAQALARDTGTSSGGVSRAWAQAQARGLRRSSTQGRPRLPRCGLSLHLRQNIAKTASSASATILGVGAGAASASLALRQLRYRLVTRRLRVRFRLRVFSVGVGDWRRSKPTACRPSTRQSASRWRLDSPPQQTRRLLAASPPEQSTSQGQRRVTSVSAINARLRTRAAGGVRTEMLDFSTDVPARLGWG